MAEKDRERPSLELPSLGFGRKRRQPESTRGPVDTTEPAPQPAPAPAPRPERETPAPPDPGNHLRPEPEAPHEPDASAPRRGFALPPVSGLAASIVTGVLVGILGVGMVWGSTRLCELVRGTSSCGTPGFVLLIAVVAVAALLGNYVLQAFAVPEPLSTSVLGVGVTTVVTLLFLGGHLFEWWMAIAVPLVAAASYALSHSVTTAVVGPIEDNMHR